MSPINWNDSFNVGNPEIDQQHREWVRIFNELENSVLQGSPENTKAKQMQTLKEILEFTEKHFEAEEKLMSRYNYPGTVQHKRMHKEFNQKIYDQYRLILSGELVLNSEVLKLIQTWFMHHTASEDIKAFSFIALAMKEE